MTGAPRIAFYTDSAIVGGAEISLGVLLSELDPAFEAVVTGTDPGVVDWLVSRRPGAASRILPAVAGKKDGRAFAGNVGAITSLRPRIFHANLAVPSAGQYALAAATLVPGVRTVAVEHLPYPLQGGLQTWLKRVTSRRLAAHVAVGQEAARQVERYARLSPGSVRVIHNGVPDVALEPLPRPYAGPTIGAIGRLDRQKGFDLVLRSLVELPDSHLVVVGDGPERHALEQLAAELGVSARTEFQGWRDDARRHLTTFDVFVAPYVSRASPWSLSKPCSRDCRSWPAQWEALPRPLSTGGPDCSCRPKIRRRWPGRWRRCSETPAAG